MPVMKCSGVSPCSRMISVSAVPGGNPAALQDPAGFALVWALCAACGTYTCDRCLNLQHGRCTCGASVRITTAPERISIAQELIMGKKPTAPALS